MTDQPSMMADAGADGEGQGPVVRDKRRIDPETGQLRDNHSTATASDKEGDVVDAADAELLADAQSNLAAERLEDLQRLQAEYVNYRKRVERDKETARELAIAGVLESMLPVLDDVNLAREHGDLAEGPFVAIADKLESTLGRFGLVRFGAVGDEFDPAIHEALMNTPSADATVATVALVMQPGYMLGERVIRPARVGVNSPA